MICDLTSLSRIRFEVRVREKQEREICPPFSTKIEKGKNDTPLEGKRRRGRKKKEVMDENGNNLSHG